LTLARAVEDQVGHWKMPDLAIAATVAAAATQG